jgi:hypothetical protein
MAMDKPPKEKAYLLACATFQRLRDLGVNPDDSEEMRELIDLAYYHSKFTDEENDAERWRRIDDDAARDMDKLWAFVPDHDLSFLKDETTMSSLLNRYLENPSKPVLGATTNIPRQVALLADIQKLCAKGLTRECALAVALHAIESGHDSKIEGFVQATQIVQEDEEFPTDVDGSGFAASFLWGCIKELPNDDWSFLSDPVKVCQMATQAEPHILKFQEKTRLAAEESHARLQQSIDEICVSGSELDCVFAIIQAKLEELRKTYGKPYPHTAEVIEQELDRELGVALEILEETVASDDLRFKLSLMAAGIRDATFLNDPTRVTEMSEKAEPLVTELLKRRVARSRGWQG